MSEKDKLRIVIIGNHLNNSQLIALLSALENTPDPGVVVTHEPELTDKKQKMLLTTSIGLSLSFNLAALPDIPTYTGYTTKKQRSWRPQDAFKKKHRHKLPNKPRK